MWRYRNLLEQPYGFILGKPSAEYAKKLADDERARVAAQVNRLSAYAHRGPVLTSSCDIQAEALGQEKLKQLGELLQASLAANEVQIPTEELGTCDPQALGLMFIH
jgi:hypothetical protein